MKEPLVETSGYLTEFYIQLQNLQLPNMRMDTFEKK